MKQISYLFIAFLYLSPLMGSAQYCTEDTRFTNAEFFSSTEVTTVTDLVYGTANNFEGNSQDLLMDIWYPSAANETLSKRPFILLIHGGGFINGSKQAMSVECRSFAQRGYVAATMSYRLGWDINNPLGQSLATYRAQQDAQAAMRYIVQNANTYGIDTDWMFIGGISAGAITSLNVVFVNEAEWEAFIPGIVANLGSLNTSGNNLTHSFDIKAVYNNCGMTREVAIQAEDMVPVISFHGYLDNIVPIGSFTPGGTAGSAVIHDLLSANGVCSEFTIDSLGNHCPFPRDFRVQRVACFFKSVLCNNCSSNYFTEVVPADCPRITVVGLDEAAIRKKPIQIYPNPASDYLNISGASNEYQITIMDAIGRLQKAVTLTENIHTVDISTLPAGLYFIRIKDLNNDLYEVQKIIKH